MNEEHIRLVAKVQHFYEIMVNINGKILDESIASPPHVDKRAACETASAINSIIDEYEKVFESFLYKEGYENR